MLKLSRRTIRPQNPVAFLLLASLAGAGFLNARPASAYEEDTHFGLTAALCRTAGMSADQAVFVALYDQGMDDSLATVANSGVIPRVTEEFMWHSIPIGGTTAEISARKDQLWQQVMNEHDPRQQLIRLGVFFHYQQDSWAHRHHPNHNANFQPFSTPLGHAEFGHQPDRPPLDPDCALKCLEESLSFARQFITTCQHATPSPVFDLYQPSTAGEEKNWTDSRNGLFFHQLSSDPSTAAHHLVTDLVRAQIDAYTSSFDGNPNYFGRSTADQSAYPAYRDHFNAVCKKFGLGTVLPFFRSQVTWLSTTQLKDGNSLGNSNYKVRIFTGDKWLAGTDADISISIKGASGDLPPQILNRMIDHNAFERNTTEVLNLNDRRDVGAIKSITIRRDGSGSAAGWFLGSVQITGPGPAVHNFVFNNWLEDNKLSCTLTPQ